MRVGASGQPFGLDFGAIMAMAAARVADAALIADVLPDVEAAVLDGLSGDASEEGGDHG